MATITLGTTLTTSLVAVVFSGDPAVLSDADLATINRNILDDLSVAHPVASTIGTGGFVRQGQLYVPNRGVLTLRAGDYIAYDPDTGWPILLSAAAADGTDWAHS